MSSSAKTVTYGVTVLMLRTQFSLEDLLQHFASTSNPVGVTNPLTAEVLRFRREDDSSPMQPVDASVDNELSFCVTGIQTEASSTSRYMLDVVVTEDLSMSSGVIIKVGTGHYAEGEQINAGTQMRLFVDCAAKRGAVYAYEPGPSDIIILPQPEGIQFNPNPTDIVPYGCRQSIDK